jgi:hypothetical protein
VKIEFTADGVEIVHDNGYLVCPPALHAERGTLYRFLEGYEPWARPIATFPAHLLDRLDSEQKSSGEAERRDDESPILKNHRHAHLRRLAGAMRRAGAGYPEIEAALLTLNARRCLPPKQEHVVRALARDIVARYRPGERS